MQTVNVGLLKVNGHCFYNFLDLLNQSKKSADFATVSFLDREMSAPDTKLRIQSSGYKAPDTKLSKKKKKNV